VKILTGNDLASGDVVWWDGKSWSRDVNEAVDAGDQADAILAAEEAAQRALIRAVRRLDGFRGESSLFTWLARICRNELADMGEIAARDAARNVTGQWLAVDGGWTCQ
jgi:NAD(P)-dependent dehydrogenase (short-subunit alcohol dehydrogenase family)